MQILELHSPGIKQDNASQCARWISSLVLCRLGISYVLGMQAFQESEEAQSRPDITLLQTDLRALVMAASRTPSCKPCPVPDLPMLHGMLPAWSRSFVEPLPMDLQLTCLGSEHLLLCSVAGRHRQTCCMLEPKNELGCWGSTDGD